jgi:rare lipoprotein A
MEEGLASWYGKDFHGKKTASGEVYNMYALTAAHKVLPMHTVVQVTNLENGRSVNLRINDRGPFVRGRIIDLSYEGAKQLDIVGAGTARVRVAASGDSIPGYKHGELPGRFYVQVGSFTVKQNADRLVADVRARGYRETRIQRAIVGGKRFWRVQAGVFTSLNAARAAQDRLESQYPSCFVIAD